MAWDVSIMLMSGISDFAVFGNNLHHLFWPTGKGLDHGIKILFFFFLNPILINDTEFLINGVSENGKNSFVHVKSLMSL
jgi:hypothetical protein